MNCTSFVRGFLLSLLVLCLTHFTSSAQLKINSGYDLSFTTSNPTDEILENFNTENPNALSSFGNFGISNGLLVGLRYEIDFLGIEASWIFRLNDEETIISEVGDVTTSVELFGRFQTFSFGIDNQFDWFSYGGSVDYNISTIKASLDQVDNKTLYLRENNYSATIYLGFTTPESGLIRLSLRPFVKIPITNIDYNALDINLNGGTTVNDSEGRPLIFGLRVVLTNG